MQHVVLSIIVRIFWIKISLSFDLGLLCTGTCNATGDFNYTFSFHALVSYYDYDSSLGAYCNVLSFLFNLVQVV